MNNNGRKRIGLALGGGVARGPAHIGVLAVLERAGIPIDCVAGTSAGSVVGAVYCAGLTIPQLCELAQTTRWGNIASLVWPRQGFVNFSRMERWIQELVGQLDIRDLAIPFVAVATDLTTGEPVYLREGPLGPALRASSSVPGIVAPIEIGGRFLCDGGVSDNLPVDAVRELGADFVIGVDLFAPRPPRPWGPVGVSLAALETLIRQAGGGVRTADCLITPDISASSFLRFSQSQTFIEKGMAAAEAMLPAIRRALAEEVGVARSGDRPQ